MSDTPSRTHRPVEFALARPRLVMVLVGLLTVVLALATLNIEVDTDPENMLPGDDPVRVRNAQMRDQFGTHETIVVGIVAEDDRGILTPERLNAVADLHQRIAGFDGVVAPAVVSPVSALDRSAASSDTDVATVVDAVEANPLLAGNVISADGTTAAIFVPLEDKNRANPVTAEIEAAVDDLPALSSLGSYVAGLPLAEEAFGREMFVQMGIFAPMAGLLVFGLMMWFFRRVRLVASAMAVAMLAVIWTMGLLIGTGNAVHIMSSMIPIFLMPIAILDSVHVLSEFFDRYPHHLDRRATLRVVYGELYRPLAYTSITTGVAFASLAITPIPPVRVFGIFVAVGVAIAWLLTVAFLPAYVTLMSEKRLARALQTDPESQDPLLVGSMRALGRFAARRRLAIPLAFVALGVLAVPAAARITVNDNPVNWFKAGSSVREASEVLNRHLPGTFRASLLLRAEEPGALLDGAALETVRGLQSLWDDIEVVGSSASYAEVVGDPATATADLGAAFDAQPGLVGTLVTEDVSAANLQLQLSDGDNEAMSLVVDATDRYLEANPLPDGVTAVWAGETYLNLVWQDKMVTGMAQAFATTLVVVLVLLVALFRSVRWALLSVVPVLWTVLVVYGVIGLAGKNYDMPIAVLSTLVLGIGVDFAIHFVERYRALDDEFGDPAWALRAFFEEPARALTRNALVIAVGFTPLFLASLTPYLVVGAFLASIIVLSWLTTLLLLPAVVSRRRPASPPASH